MRIYPLFELYTPIALYQSGIVINSNLVALISGRDEFMVLKPKPDFSRVKQGRLPADGIGLPV